MGDVTVSGSIEIRATVEYVFRQVTDPRRALEWNPGIVEIRDASTPVRVGTTWTQVVAAAGRMMTLHCCVARYEPPLWGELDVTGDQRGRIITRCRDVGGRTLLTQEMTFERPRGPLGSLAGGVMKGMLQRELTRTLDRQRATLERESGDSR